MPTPRNGPVKPTADVGRDELSLGRAQDGSHIHIGDAVLVQCDEDPPYPGVIVSGAPAKIRLGETLYRAPAFRLGVVWLGLEHRQPPYVNAV